MPDSTYAKLTNAEKTRQLVSARLKEKGISLRHTETIARRPIDSPSPASFAQQRLWLLEHISPGSRYNMQVVLRLRGALHIQSLNSAWRELLKRHEILRTTFGVADEQIMQFISTEPGSSMAVFDLTEENPSERESRLRHHGCAGTGADRIVYSLQRRPA